MLSIPPQVKMFMPKYFLDTDEAISGEFGGEFSNDKGTYGNATLRLFIRGRGERSWKYVMQQDYAPVSTCRGGTGRLFGEMGSGCRD